MNRTIFMETLMSLSWLRSSSGLHSAVLGCLIAAFGGVTLQSQQPSARNVFWSASDLFQVSENPGAKPAANPGQPPAPRKKPAPPAASHSNAHVDTELVAKNGYGQQPQLVKVSDEQIGIRYALLLRDSSGHYGEVAPGTVFHNGDHLRLSIMANQPGFLYVIQQGSSGGWSSIFPGPLKDQASGESINKIEQGHAYEIPNGKNYFRFDQNPGQEKLFLVLSRERISDLDGAIKSLKDPTHPSSVPAKPEDTAAPSEALEASNQIPDAFVQRLASRDLTLVQEEDVDEPQTGDKPGEKAVYVVSKVSYSKNESPRVVASLTLRHE
jgi:hypothetical protein